MVSIRYKLRIFYSHPHIKSMLATIPWMRSLVSTATSQVSHVSQANGSWHWPLGLGNITTGHTDQEKRSTRLLESLFEQGLCVWFNSSAVLHSYDEEKGSEKAALSHVYWSNKRWLSAVLSGVTSDWWGPHGMRPLLTSLCSPGGPLIGQCLISRPLIGCCWHFSPLSAHQGGLATLYNVAGDDGGPIESQPHQR